MRQKKRSVFDVARHMLKPGSYINVKSLQNILSAVSIICVLCFAVWWFNPAHVPNNFEGSAKILDVLLFILVSWIVWHPITMDVVLWSISSHIKDMKQQKPIPGMKVAFITAIVPQNEPRELLHKCLPAMVHADYPHDTWLLDEGNDPKVKEICDMYGVKHFSRADKIGYVTPNGKYTRTKGGNHNSWYDLHGNEYDVVAQIDLDFVPKKTFLTKTLGYFRDPKVAFVGTPQIYGNVNNSLIAQGADEQQYSFYGSILRGLSGMGMTLLIGANHIIRVKALKDIDHYTAHITEDLITGMKLHTKKWKSIYLSEPLAIGEGPFNWESYFNQQMRWAYGCMDILFHHSPRLFKKMGWRRACYYFLLQQHYFSGITMALSTLLISLYFIAGIRAADIDLFKFLTYYPVITLICWLMSVWLQRFNVPRERSSELQLAGKIVSLAAWPIWFLAFICVLLRRRLTYKVTPKGADDSKTKSSLLLFLPHFFFGLISLIGLISSFYTHRQNILMMFWAVGSAVSMLTIPFTEQIRTAVLAVYYFLIKIARFLYITDFSNARRRLNSQEFFSSENTFDDCLFLLITVIWSTITYISKIGFYSDDWAFIGNFSLAKNKSILGLFLTASTPNTLMRPMQNLYDALLYWMFGVNPLGYQIMNLIVLSLITLTLYFILRRLNMPRIITVAISLIYILLPNYSTDRFWYAAYQANLSMLLFLFSLYAGLRAISAGKTSGFYWKIISLGALVISTLSYEVVLPLFVLNMLFYWNPGTIFHQKNNNKRKKQSSFAVFNVMTAIVLIYVFVFKALTTTRLGKFDISANAIRLVNSVFHVNYLALIHNLWSALNMAVTQHNGNIILISGLLLGVLVFWYLYFVFSDENSRFPSIRYLFTITIASFIIFILGYSIFIINNRVGFSPTGIDNRVAITAAVGVAFTFIGILGLISRLILPERFAKIVFCVFVTVLAVSCYVTTNILAAYWITAYEYQRNILAQIQERFPAIPKNSTLIIDGVCPYVGPAVVFESQWDLRGALQSIYNDPGLQADIVTPRLKVTQKGFNTQIYTFPQGYPYRNLFVYNVRQKAAYLIKDIDMANAYFHLYNPDHNNGCPPASAGNGVDVF